MRLKKVTKCGKRNRDEDLIDMMATENAKGGQPDNFEEYRDIKETPEIRC